jgi:hypothetical protein
VKRSKVLKIKTCQSLSSRVFEDNVWFEDWWMVASLCDE